MKVNNFKKETDRFKDSFIECLNSSFVPILGPYVNSKNKQNDNMGINVPLKDISINSRILNDFTTNT